MCVLTGAPGSCGGGQTFPVELVGATLSSLPSRQRQFPGQSGGQEFPLDSPRPEPPCTHTASATTRMAVSQLPSSWKLHFTNGNKKTTASGHNGFNCFFVWRKVQRLSNGHQRLAYAGEPHLGQK